MIVALLMLNLAGGEDVVRVLESDEEFCRLLREAELYGRTRTERRALMMRWREVRTRTLLSPTVMGDYLDVFHDPEQEKLREPHKASIPEPSELLWGLVRLNAAFAAVMQRRSPQLTATHSWSDSESTQKT